MDLASFRRSLGAAAPPAGLAVELRALWHAAQNGWDTAHKLVQDEKSASAAWVHAHLHRIEGDLSNAGYWHHRAGRPRSEEPLEREWAAIAEALLRGSDPN
jgi:hypothetical protein